MKRKKSPLDDVEGLSVYGHPPSPEDITDPLAYARPPSPDGAIDPFAYGHPPSPEDITDPLAYAHPSSPDGAIDPFAYGHPLLPGDITEPLDYAYPSSLDGLGNSFNNANLPSPEGIRDPLIFVDLPSPEVAGVSESAQPPGGQEVCRTQVAISPEESTNSLIVRAAKDSPVDQKALLSKGKHDSGVIKAQKSSATNFFVRPIKKVIYINRMGEEEPNKEIIDSLVYINEIAHPITLKVKNIESLSKIVQRRFAEAILDHLEQNAAKAIEEEFRDAVSRCPKEFVYFEAGWQQMRGRQVYVRDGLTIGNRVKIETGMVLPSDPCNAEMLRKIWERSMCICKNRMTMAAISAFSLMGVLYRLFEEAGYTPHFTLFLFGKTGSMKTTVAKIFFIQLCEEKYRDRVRRIDADTEVSLERAVVLAGKDTITLIDDFSPAKTERKKREMADKLEMIIRMVGDGSSRSRSSIKLDDRRGEGVQGMVALTGELLGKGVSSNLRCFYCKMVREEVNDEMVTWFQQNEYAYTTLIAAFADFVGANYKRMVDIIRVKFREERKELSGVLKEYRLIDSAATLRIASHIFGIFLTDCCRVPSSEAEEKILKIQSGINNCALISEELSTDDSPSIVFIQAISALMRTGNIKLMAEKRMLTGLEEGDGFEDENFLYFNHDIIYKKVVSFLRQTNRYFPYDIKEVMAMLADDGIIKTAANGQGKHTYCTRVSMGNGVRQNFLKIRKSIFDSVCNNEFEYGKGKKE